MTTRPDTQSASLNPSSRLRARLGLQVKRMLAGPCGRKDRKPYEKDLNSTCKDDTAIGDIDLCHMRNIVFVYEFTFPRNKSESGFK